MGLRSGERHTCQYREKGRSWISMGAQASAQPTSHASWTAQQTSEKQSARRRWESSVKGKWEAFSLLTNIATRAPSQTCRSSPPSRQKGNASVRWWRMCVKNISVEVKYPKWSRLSFVVTSGAYLLCGRNINYLTLALVFDFKNCPVQLFIVRTAALYIYTLKC